MMSTTSKGQKQTKTLTDRSELPGFPGPNTTEEAWEALGMAEFPIVTTAIKRPALDTLDFIEKSTRKGATYERRWRMVGSAEYGLPRLYDLDLYVGVLVLAERHGYESRLIKVTMHELCKIAGVSRGGATYDRIKAGVRRFIHTGYSAHGVFWPDKAAQPVELEEWRILTEARLLPAYQDKAVQDGLPPSYILLGEKFLSLLKSDTRKPIPLGMWRKLSGGLAKPLFHYLDTAIYRRDRFEIGLKRLGNHIGQTTHYAPSHAQRNLKPYLQQFVDLGFLHSFDFQRSRSKTDPVKLIVFPGERARRKRGKAVRVPDVTEVPQDASEARITRNSRHPEAATDDQLVRRFFEKRHGLEDKNPTVAQRAKARAILEAAGDYETAATAVDLAARTGRDNDGFPDHLGGVLESTFIDQAKKLRDRQKQDAIEAEQRQRAAEKNRIEHEAYTAWLDEQLEQLKQTPEYDQLYQEQLDKAADYQRKSNTSWSKEMVEKSARHWLRGELSKQRFSRAAWLRSKTKDDAPTSS